ncbi:MAG: FtsW/RodA/SpoVE family cell cycle protein [Aquificae bacterium]|nr:FtsW/RodA/SpoVE family cell cycle protein [Aquificota bacterium]
MDRLSKFYPDPVILFTVLLLGLIGFMSVFSVKVAPHIFEGVEFHHLRRPLLFLVFFVVGIFAMSAMSHMINYKKLNNKKVVYALMGLSLFLLLLVLIKKFALGKSVDRWLVGTSLQPSELSKLIIIIFIAHYVSKKGVIERFSFFGWVVFLVSLHAVLLFLQPDKGMAIFIFALTSVMLWIGCTSPRIYIPIVLIFAGVAFLMLTFGGDYVHRRLVAWRNPMEDYYGSGYQVIQALLSFMNGGLLGQGYGKGFQKMGPLTQSDTDYVLATLGEELGLPGIIFVFVLLSVLLWRLIRIAKEVSDVFGKLIVAGVAVNIIMSASVNVLMAVNILPPKGIPLPFVSYGVSNLLVNLISLGLVGAVYKRQLYYRML